MADKIMRHKTLPVPVDPASAGGIQIDPKTRKRVLAGWLCVCTLAGCWAATQLVAARLGYHADLGAPIWVSDGGAVRLYTPWSFVRWSIHLHRRIPNALEQGLGGFLVTGALFGLGALVLGKKTTVTGYAHGSARWATPTDIKAMKLVGEQGVVLGRDLSGKLLSHNGPEHIMVFAPTRSGKGVGIVVPTLLQWTESVVVLDFKGENYGLTSGFRGRFSHVLRFEPTSLKSARFNPLSEVRLRTLNEIRDAQNIAQILCDPGSAGADSSHWVESAADVLSAVILHVLYVEDHKSLAGVNSFLKKPGETLEEKFSKMEQTPHLGAHPHPFIAQAARSVLNKVDKERSGIISSISKALRLWTDPLIAKTTDHTDFQLADLMTGAHPTSLYLVVPPSDADRLRPLLRMLITQLIRGQLETLERRDHRLLMMLDEFPALGRLGFMEEAMAYVAGYGIKLCIIAQDTKQMEAVYGQANTILSNCGVRVTFAASDIDTASKVSKMLGKATWTKQQEAESGKKGFFGLDNKSRSQLEYARDLLTPDEVANLDHAWELVMVTGKPAIVTPKVRYYEDDYFKQRLLPEPPTWRDTPRPCEKCGARIKEQEALRAQAQLDTKELEALAIAALQAKAAARGPDAVQLDEGALLQAMQPEAQEPLPPHPPAPQPLVPTQVQSDPMRDDMEEVAPASHATEQEHAALPLALTPLVLPDPIEASPSVLSQEAAMLGDDCTDVEALVPPMSPPILAQLEAPAFDMDDPFAQELPDDVAITDALPDQDPASELQWVLGD